jgi:hypothetical protein
MEARKAFATMGAIVGLAGCAADLVSFFVFASKYNGYDQIGQALSELGSSISPVSHMVSTWWIIFGTMMILLSAGFGALYSREGKYARIAALLIFLYGLGEGIGSGIFKFDIVNNVKTVSYSFHEVFGSIGVFGIIALPFVVLKTKSFSKNARFRMFTWGIVVCGILFFVLFSIRYVNLSNAVTDLINKFTGLWQRLFLLVYYIYLAAVCLKMIRDVTAK